MLGCKRLNKAAFTCNWNRLCGSGPVSHISVSSTICVTYQIVGRSRKAKISTWESRDCNSVDPAILHLKVRRVKEEK